MPGFQLDVFLKDLWHTLKVYFFAQFKIMAIEFIVLLIGFVLMGFSWWSILLALAIALFDFFPIFDTAFILIPWAIFAFFNDQVQFGFSLLGLWLVAELISTLAEVRILGRDLKLPLWLTLLITVGSIFVAGPIGPLLAVILVPIASVVRNSPAFQQNQRDYRDPFKNFE